MDKEIRRLRRVVSLFSVVFLLLSTSIIAVSGQEQEEQEYDFYLVLPEIVEVSQGDYALFEVAVYPIGEYSWPVLLVAEYLTLPEGVDIKFEPESVVPPGVVVLNVSACPEAETGDFIIIIEAQGLDPNFMKRTHTIPLKVKEKVVEKYDLAPVYLNPIQVTKTGYANLVLEKNTVFEVGIYSTFPNVVTARIKLGFEEFEREEYVTDPLPLKSRTTTYYILPLKDDLEEERTETGAYTPIALELLDAPKPTGKPAGVYVEVDPDNRVDEKDETNNRLPPVGHNEYPVRDYAALTLWYKPPPLFPGDNFTSLLGPGPPYQLELFAAASTEFILGTYPIADHEIDYRVSLPPKLSWLQQLGKGKTQCKMVSRTYYERYLKRYLNASVVRTTRNWVIIDLIKAKQLGLLNASRAASAEVLYSILRGWSNLALRWSTAQHQYRYVVVFPQGWLTKHFHSSYSGTLGFMWSAIKGAVFSSVRDICAPAHEIGHSYGLRLDKEEYNRTFVGFKGKGFWVNKYREIDDICRHDLQLDHPCVGSLYCFMSSQIGPNCWICNDDYRWLQGNYTHSDPEVLLVDGRVYENGSVYLYPFHRIPNSVSSIPLGTTGNYYITLLGSEEQILGQAGFNATFQVYVNPEHVEIDFEPFMFTIPWIEETTQIQIRDEEGNVLASRTVSPNPPQITIKTPSGGETFYMEGECKIELEVTDPDGDSITFTILYSTDNGENWYPLIMDLTGTQFEWDLSWLYLPPGEQYLIRIIASDGVNSVDVTSDAAFTVVEGAPPPPLPMTTIIIVVVAVAAIALIALYFKKKRKG